MLIQGLMGARRISSFTPFFMGGRCQQEPLDQTLKALVHGIDGCGGMLAHTVFHPRTLNRMDHRHIDHRRINSGSAR